MLRTHLFSIIVIFIIIIQPAKFVIGKNSNITDKLLYEPIFKSKFYFIERGKRNKQNIVLCHGTGDLGAKIWDDLIPKLEKKYHVYAFDLPGFGRSEKKNKLYSPKNYAKFINWLVKKHIKKPIILVGHSLGGAIALYYAGEYNNSLKRLIIVDAAGIIHRTTFTKNSMNYLISGKLEFRGKNLLAKPLGAIKYFINTAIENIDNQFMPENLDKLLESETFRKKTLDSNPIKISGISLINTDFSRIIPRVKVPTFLIWGEKDPIAPLRTAKLLYANIPGSTLDIMKGLKHNPMLENPKKFNRLLIKELTKKPDKKINRMSPTHLLMKKEINLYNKDNITITGDYKLIKLAYCSNIKIINSNIGYLDIYNSKVTIENSKIISKNTGVKIASGIITMTGVVISAKLPIFTSNSKLDLAGVRLIGKKASIKSEYTSTIVFSVSNVSSLTNKKQVHRIMKLTHDQYY